MPQVLVVDDDYGIRILVRDVLLDAGYEVVEAANVGEAQELIARRRPDLLVLDLSLPDGGDRPLRDVVGLCRRVLVLSGSSQLRERAQELGANGALPKPFDIDDLVRAVAQVLGGSDRGADEGSGAHSAA